MPSKSPAQAKLMRAVAHNPDFARKVGVPPSVGKEFNNADKKLVERSESRAASAKRETRLGDNFAHPAVMRRAVRAKRGTKPERL